MFLEEKKIFSVILGGERIVSAFLGERERESSLNK